MDMVGGRVAGQPRTGRPRIAPVPAAEATRSAQTAKRQHLLTVCTTAIDGASYRLRSVVTAMLTESFTR